MSEHAHSDGRHHKRPRPAPAPSTSPNAERRHRPGLVVAGFVLSLVALSLPAWLAIDIAISYDDWFSDDGAFFSGAFWSAFFIVVIVAPVELLLAGSGFVLSLLGIKRLPRMNARLRNLGMAGIAISAVSILATAIVAVIAIANVA